MYPSNPSENVPKSPPPPPSYGLPPPPPPPPSYTTNVPTQFVTSPNQWSTGLCDCCSNVSNCCCTFWCPCIPFGQMAEILDKGTTSCGVHGVLYTLLLIVTGCQCIYSCMYRSKLRQQYMLPEEPCNDCVVHCCCEPCAMCQEYRELQHRGFDVSLGWQGNMERPNLGIVMPPVGPGQMKR